MSSLSIWTRRRSPPDKIAYPGPLPFRGEAEPLEQLSRGELAVAHLDPQPYLLHRLADPLVRVELGELLGQVGQPNGLTPDDRSVRVQPRAGRTGDHFPGEPFPGEPFPGEPFPGEPFPS